MAAPRPAGLLIGGANLNNVAYVNGEFTRVQDARVSILDRGFLFGDGVYEVAAVLEGKLIDYETHLSRLERSLREMALGSPTPLADLCEIQRELIARNGLREGIVYLQITRGAAARDFGFPRMRRRHWLCSRRRRTFWRRPPRGRDSGQDRSRHQMGAPGHKEHSLLAQVLAKQAAVAEGCQEAWMFDEDGMVTEGASSSSFIITKQGVIVTRPMTARFFPAARGKRSSSRGGTWAFD